MIKIFSLGLLSVLVLSSCSDTYHDVEIQNLAQQQVEDGIVISNDRSSGFYSNLHSVIKTTPRNLESSLKISKLDFELDKMKRIDSAIFNLNELIYQLKFDVLEKGGASPSLIKNKKKGRQKILKSDMGYRISSSYFQFDISNQSLTKSVDQLFFDGDKPTEAHKKIVNEWNKTIRILIEQTSYYRSRDKIYRAKLNFDQIPEVITDENFELVFGENVNVREDGQVIKDLLYVVYKKEFHPKRFDATLGMNQLFKNSNGREAYFMLTSLQNDLSKARALAFAHISSKVGGCDYGFDKIDVLVSGPTVARAGEQIELTVRIAAIDTYNQPQLEVDQEVNSITVEEGIGKVKTKIPSNLEKFKYSGTISIKNKSGVLKIIPWEREVQILP